jgi:hypothetical protein
LATELLFEHLVIRDMATLRSILEIFADRSASTSDTESPQYYGWFTKRIDLHLFRGFTASGESLTTAVEPAAALIRQCINLVALAIGMPEYLARVTASSVDAAAVLRGIVEQSNAPALKHFHLVYGRFSTPVTKALLRFDKMEILTLYISRGPYETPLDEAVSFPNLHTPHLTGGGTCNFLDHLAPCALPALRNLSAYLRSLPKIFFEKYRPQILYLDIG